MRRELQHLVKKWSLDIPFERSVRANYSSLQKLVALGVTWKTIAHALSQAGARHKNDRLISARQMNSVFLRVGKSRLTNIADDISGVVHSHMDEVDPKDLAPSPRKQSSVGGVSRMAITSAVSMSAWSTKANLAQRLNEARSLSEAIRTDYDD